MKKYRTRTDIYTRTKIEKETGIQRVLFEFTSNYSGRFSINEEYKNYVIYKWNKRKYDRLERELHINNTTTRKRVKI